MGLKKEFASMHLFELHYFSFIEPPSPHALNRNSTDVDGPPTIPFYLKAHRYYAVEDVCSSGWCKVLRAAQYQDCYHSYFSILKVLTNVIEVKGRLVQWN